MGKATGPGITTPGHVVVPLQCFWGNIVFDSFPVKALVPIMRKHDWAKGASKLNQCTTACALRRERVVRQGPIPGRLRCSFGPVRLGL